jgi:hypothetical protein
MSLAAIKRRITVGTKLKLVRHDGLCPIVVRGNLGNTVLPPKIHIGMVRDVCTVHSHEFALLTPIGDRFEQSYVTWPKASRVRATQFGFEIDLNDDGQFTKAMGYEFVE